MNTNQLPVNILGINFYPLSQFQEKKWEYPGGEIGVIAKNFIPHYPNDGVDVLHRIQSSDDLMELIMTANALYKNFGTKINNLLII